MYSRPSSPRFLRRPTCARHALRSGSPASWNDHMQYFIVGYVALMQPYTIWRLRSLHKQKHRGYDIENQGIARLFKNRVQVMVSQGSCCNRGCSSTETSDPWAAAHPKARDPAVAWFHPDPPPVDAWVGP